MTDLDAALLRAHADADGPRLSALYTQAADEAEARGNIEATCFYLTHAYVYALEAGLATSGALNKRLSDHGRDVVQEDLTS